MKQTSARSGRTHNVGSEMKWADWQRPPVMCAGCGRRVRLSDSFFASRERGTFHIGCQELHVPAD